MPTTTEAAAVLGLTRRRIVALIKAGRLKADKPGRDWVVDAESVEALKQQDRPRGRPKQTPPPRSAQGGREEETR